jgi:hypothetical protein
MKGKRISRKYEVRADKGLVMFWSHIGRHWWHTKAYFAEEARGLRPNQFRRLHCNEWVSGESAFITPEMWDAIVDPSLTPILVGGRGVHVGIDLGVKSDTSAVVGTGGNEMGKQVVLFHRIWKPMRGKPVPLGDVRDYVKKMCRCLQCCG